MKKMRITIKTDGTTTMRVEGAAGESCLDFTRLFEEALGKVEDRVMCEQGETASEDVHIYDEPAT
jgi:hypothetical protein